MRMNALMVSVLLSLTTYALPAHADTAIETNGVSLEGCPHQFPPGQSLAAVDLVCADGTHIGFIPQQQGDHTIYQLRRYRIRTEPQPVPLRETAGPATAADTASARVSDTNCIRVAGSAQPVCGIASDPRTLPAGTVVESASSPGPTFTRIDERRNSSGNYRWVSTGQTGTATVVVVKPRNEHRGPGFFGALGALFLLNLAVEADNPYNYNYGSYYDSNRYLYNRPYRYRGGYDGTFTNRDGERVSRQCLNPRAGSWGGCPR